MTPLRTIELADRPGVSLRLEVHTEDLPLEGNVLASGDPQEDQQAEQDIRDEWDHNDLCWCALRVVAELENEPAIYGDDYLCGVSILEKYLTEGTTLEGEAQQMAEDHGMIDQAIHNLRLAIDSAQSAIREFEETH